MPLITPIHFTTTGTGDISILHSKGILRQFIEQLLKGISFYSLDFDASINPLKMIISDEKLIIVICKDNRLVFMNR